MLKNASGSYNAVYILPRALYTKTIHNLIYSLATLYIGGKEMKLTPIQKLWLKIGRIPTSTRRSRWSK